MLARVLDAHRSEIHTALPGRVRTYDPDARTAEIVLGARDVVRALDDDADADTVQDYPVLIDVPVVWPSAGGVRVEGDMQPGDGVLVIFPEASVGPWLATGEAGDPGIATRHGLDGAVAIPGLWWRTAAPDPGSGAIVINTVDSNTSLIVNRGRVQGSVGSTRFEVLDGEIRIGGTGALARAAQLGTHLDAIAASITALATATGAPVTYTSAQRAALNGTAPIPTQIAKGA